MNRGVSEAMVEAACKAQWQAERNGKNQHDAMEAALEAALAAEAEGWRDMSSAPKDGTQFFAYTQDGHVDFFHWQHLEYRDAPIGWRDGFIRVYGEDDPTGPQGWMPVPRPAAPHPSGDGGK